MIHENEREETKLSILIRPRTPEQQQDRVVKRHNNVTIKTHWLLFRSICFQPLLHFVASDEFLRIKGGRAERRTNVRRKCEKNTSVYSINRALLSPLPPLFKGRSGATPFAHVLRRPGSGYKRNDILCLYAIGKRMYRCPKMHSTTAL